MTSAYEHSGLLGFWTLSIVQYSRECDISGTWSLFFLAETVWQKLPLRISNVNHLFRCLPPPHLRTETNNVSETSCSLGYHTMHIVRKPSNPEYGLYLPFTVL
jgi:hypothetical protein